MDEKQLFNTRFLTQKHENSFEQQRYTFSIMLQLIVGLENRCQIINTKLVENAFRQINNLT